MSYKPDTTKLTQEIIALVLECIEEMSDEELIEFADNSLAFAAFPETGNVFAGRTFNMAYNGCGSVNADWERAYGPLLPLPSVSCPAVDLPNGVIVDAESLILENDEDGFELEQLRSDEKWVVEAAALIRAALLAGGGLDSDIAGDVRIWIERLTDEGYAEDEAEDESGNK